MDRNQTVRVLNRLYVIHYRSLPMYLGSAKPRALRGDEAAREMFQQIVADQQSMIDRIGSRILDLDGEVQSGEFPMVFTDYHDLAYRFLVEKMLEHQQRDLAAIRECVSQLAGAPVEEALAQQCLGMAKAHFDSLRELQEQVSQAH